MLLIQNGYIKTMAGADIENGAVLIDDNGKIAAVGTDLVAPSGARVIDAGGRLVTPGCVEAHCHIGLDNEAVGWEGHDYNDAADPITPQMRAIDAIPLENITGIYKIDKRIKFFGWNKAEEYRSDRYKPYQIKQSGFALTVKNCYALRFHSDFGEDYEIFFPTYELDTWTALTGVAVKEES